MKKRILRLAIGVALILMIPLVAMQFNKGVDWDLGDFIVAGVLLFGTGFVYIFSTRNVKNANRRMIIGAICLIVLIAVWAELAVGVFGTPFAGS